MSNQGHRIGYRTLGGIYANVRGHRFLVGGIDTREILDRSPSCKLIKPFRIAAFRDRDGNMHVHFYEPVRSGNDSRQLPVGGKG